MVPHELSIFLDQALDRNHCYLSLDFREVEFDKFSCRERDIRTTWVLIRAPDRFDCMENDACDFVVLRCIRRNFTISRSKTGSELEEEVDCLNSLVSVRVPGHWPYGRASYTYTNRSLCYSTSRHFGTMGESPLYDLWRYV